MKAKYYAINGMEETEIKCDGGVVLRTDCGQVIELYFRKSDGEIAITSKGRIGVFPTASNCFRVKDIK